MANEKVKITGYAKREFYNDGIEYRNFSDDLVGLQLTSKGGTPLFTNGNFTITTNTDDKINKFYNNGVISDYFTLDNLENENSLITFSNNNDLKLNSDKSDLSMYALFGSLTEFVRTSMEDIITDWAASLYIRENDVLNPLNSGPTFENYVYDTIRDESTFKISGERIENNFEINYNQENNNINSFSLDNSLRNIVSNFSSYVLDFNNLSYEILDFTGTTVNDNNIYLKVTGNPFTNPTDNVTRYHIRPNNLIIESFFKDLSDFKGFLLNRLTLPKYTASFSFPIQSEDGTIVFKNEKLTWPVTDGYNIDFNTTQYVTYARRLFEIAGNYDNNLSDLITRELTSDSISDFDTVRSCDGEVIDSESQKMTRTLRIYGRQYDEINKYIQGISFANVISYDKKNNAPDDLVKNIARVLGWELTSSLVENDLVSTFLEPKSSEFSGQSRGLNRYEAEIELWRRLILNSPWIWKSKGSRKAVEFLLDFIGTPKGLVNFNEYVYVSDEPVDVEEIKSIMDSLFGTREIDSLPIDNEGFPKPHKNGTIINGTETYFQKGGNWYRQTSGLDSTSDILTGNNPHIGPYDGGKEYIDQFNNIIPNFSGVTLTEVENFTQNKNIFINYNNGLISDLSVETVVATSNYNVDIETTFSVEKPSGGCLYSTEWILNIYIDNIIVGDRIIHISGPESEITLPTDINFISGATEILSPLDIEVIVNDAPISNGQLIFINNTDSCESSIFLNREIRLEATFNTERICTNGNNNVTSETINLSSDFFNYAGSGETYNYLVDYNNNQLLNEDGGDCYRLNTEVIEDPKPSIEETDCGCEVEDCDQSLRFSVTYLPQENIVYPCLRDNGIEGFELGIGGLVQFIGANNQQLMGIPKECCEQFGFIYFERTGECRCTELNEPPTVDGLFIELVSNEYVFNSTDFTTNFMDPNGDNPDTVNINTLPSCGILEWNNSPITTGFTFDYNNANNLTWVIPNLTVEPDGDYIYISDLQEQINDLESSGFTQTSYSNGVYTFTKLGQNTLPSSVDGTFDSLPVTAPSSGFNSNVTGAGFFNGVGSADSHNQPQGNVARGCPPSPQGGIFAGAIAKNQPSSTVESFFTNVDVVAGNQYVISFYQAHAGDDIGGGAQIGDITNWEVVIDGVTLQSPTMDFKGFGSQTWEYVELIFSATTTITGTKLEFFGGDGIILGSNTRGCYPAIDDVKFRQISNQTSETETIVGSPVSDCCFSFQISDDHPTNPLFSNPADICLTETINTGSTISCNEDFSFNSSAGSGIYHIDVNLGTDTGIVNLDYNSGNIPDRFEIMYDGNIIADSKYVGGFLTGNPPNADTALWEGGSGSGMFVGKTYSNVPKLFYTNSTFTPDGNTENVTVNQNDVATFGNTSGSGTLSFNKTSATPSNITIIITSLPDNTGWDLNVSCPVSTGNTNQGVRVEVGIGDCVIVPSVWNVAYVADNSSTSVENGDIIYSDFNLTIPYDGNNDSHKLRIPSSGGPSLILDREFLISPTGVVSNANDCNNGGGNPNNGQASQTNTSDNNCLRRWEGSFNAGSSDSVTAIFGKNNSGPGSGYNVDVTDGNTTTTLSNDGQTANFTGTVTYDTGEMANTQPVQTQNISFINNTTGETAGPFDISAENTTTPC